jgi:outer membrane protein
MIRFNHLVAVLVTSIVLATSSAQAEARREVRLSLADAVALSLKNNPEIAIAGFAPRRAAAEVKQQRGVFDPVLSVFAGIDRDKTPAGSPALGSFRNSVTAEARLGGRLPLGTEYELSYGTTRLDSDSQLSPTNPSSSSYVQLSVRQPLLRGFGTDINRAGITIARGNERIADLGFRRHIEAALTTTVAAYWRLVRAHRSLAVARESLELAQRLVERTQARVTAGDLPTIELTQARASVAAREEAVILGEAEVGNANDALSRLLVVDAGDVFGVTFVPSDEPTTDAATLASAALLQDAFRQRPELQAAREAVKTAEVAVAAAGNARRPDLSAVGSVGIGGLDATWTSAQSEIVRDIDDQHRWTVGLMFSVPLGNRSATGAYDKARLVLDEAKLSLRSLELQVTEEVRTATRDLEASAKRVEATRRASELARAQLDAGEKRMSTGLSTAFEVLRLQTDLAAAQNAEIAAMVGYRTSLVRVQFATGGLFGEYVTGAKRST